MLNKILCELFLFIAFLKSCIAVDTLFPNETIGIRQTLVSQIQVFELGFFMPGTSGNRFLGLWYKTTPDIANRDNPITDSQGVLFAISENGSLDISTGGIIIWSANFSSGVASNPILQLLDTGNLVLVDKRIKGSSEGYIWQSFDYPTDTRLPGMKMVADIDAGEKKFLTSWRSFDDPSCGDFVARIENQGLPELVIYRGKMKIYRSGLWNGVYFSGALPFPSPMFKPDLVSDKKRLLSVVEPYDSSNIFRVRLDHVSGFLMRYTMNSRKDKWNLAFIIPRDACDEYGLCGPNDICRVDKSVPCECLKGFAPKLLKEWEIQDWSGGCIRKTPLNCRNGDGFLAVRKVKYPDKVKFWLNTSMSLDECKADCLKNCNCTVYANPYITVEI